jgi:hypothetical protein
VERPDAIARLKTSRAEWDILVGSVPDDLFEEPVWEGGWTLKSIVAHVDFYEWWAGEFIRKRDWPEADERLQTWDVDARNDAMNQINQERLLADILAESPGRHAHLVGALEGMTDEQFLEPGYLGQGDDPEWQVLGMVAGNSWEHYPQHEADIRAWLASIGEGA